MVEKASMTIGLIDSQLDSQQGIRKAPTHTRPVEVCFVGVPWLYCCHHLVEIEACSVLVRISARARGCICVLDQRPVCL